MKRTLIVLCAAFVVLLIINGSTLVDAQGLDPIQIEKEINIKAGELRLGKPLAPLRLSDPTRRLNPPIQVWMREFERGRVYWLPQPFGPVAVQGDILKNFLARGGERGEFGVPLSNETTCTMHGQEGRAQLFEFALVHRRASDGEITIQPYRPEEWLAAPWCRSPTSPKPERDRSGRFQVILTGFSVDQQTDDNIVESDGKGDEVFIVAEVAQYANAGRLHGRPPLTLRRTLTSIVMGDANNQEVPRIRAGSAGNNGGLRTGDRFPTNEPWRQVGTLSKNRLPMQVWEGELSQGMVIIVPTIWEWDDGNLRAREQFVKDINIHFTFGTYQDDGLVARGVSASDIFGAGDQPIAGLGDPSSIRLDYPAAAAAVQQSVKHGPGEFEIYYAGETEKYTLYYKIERLP